MKYKRIINKLLSENRPYDSFYPEHKPIKEKLTEMNKINTLTDLIERNKPNIPLKAEQFKNQIECKNKFYFWYEVLLWNLDFDITEDYIWHRSTKNWESPEFQKIMKDFVFQALGSDVD